MINKSNIIGARFFLNFKILKLLNLLNYIFKKKSNKFSNYYKILNYV